LTRMFMRNRLSLLSACLNLHVEMSRCAVYVVGG
jgi:hypothetical protein